MLLENRGAKKPGVKEIGKIQIMTSIFMSHSKHDLEIVNYFYKAFARVGLTVKIMELEDFNKYAGYEILNKLRKESDGEAVFLGRNLHYPPTLTPEFTDNWVKFEVGAAAGVGKSVWVSEEYGKNISFPIPYVTDYVQYSLDNLEHLSIIGEIVKCNLTSTMHNAPIIRCLLIVMLYITVGLTHNKYTTPCRQSIPKYEERRDRLNLSNVT